MPLRRSPPPGIRKRAAAPPGLGSIGVMTGDRRQADADADGPTPWPCPEDAPVLLFGGSFDPPHRAHTIVASAVRDRLFGDAGRLVLVPAARSPHKAGSPGASAVQRVEMLRLATEGDRRAHIWTDEIDRAEAGGASYWVETLRRVDRLLPSSTPRRFLIGADQAAAFHRWREPEAILELAEPAVVLREPIGSVEMLVEALEREGVRSDRIDAWRRWVVRMPLLPERSTDVRAAVAANTGDADGLLDSAVLAYIRAHGLYRDG